MIEVLLVMAVVGIVMGMVVVTVPSVIGGSGDFTREAERLHALLELAGDEAVLGGNEIGFGVDREGYRFFQFDERDSTWRPMAGEPFQPRPLDGTILLELKVEGRALTLGDAREAPPVLLLSSGETTPFELTMALKERDLTRVISSDGFSGIRYIDPAEQERN